jgi:hypothetical protein
MTLVFAEEIRLELGERSVCPGLAQFRLCNSLGETQSLS